MSLVIIFILFLLLAMYLLLAPIVVLIDTTTNQYYIQLHGLAKASVEADDKELVRIKLKFLFLKFYFYPLKKSRSSKEKKLENKHKPKSKKRIGFGKGLQLLKTFKVKRLLIDIDTGNCITNAKLYPMFAFLNYKLGDFHINFEGRNQLALRLQNRPIHIIKLFINP